jgi:ADP-ribosyl-[dinitrogen reductase] hydrolase
MTDRLDRAHGCLLGLAVGDAVGTTLEFSPRDRRPPLMDMIGGGPFKLEVGQWTDDTAMALALADSLISHPDFDPRDLMERFWDWRAKGQYSCTGSCFDVGVTTAEALMRYLDDDEPFSGPTDPETAGNGSLMRLAPVAIIYSLNRDRLDAVARDQSRTTHGAPEAIDACRAYASLLADAIAGQPKEALTGPRHQPDGLPWAGQVNDVMGGSWRHKARDRISSSGYVIHSLEAALWCFHETENFADAILLAANLGHDADTTAAITGQLAGAHYGARGIPAQWLGRLAWRDQIEAMASELQELATTAT